MQLFGHTQLNMWCKASLVLLTLAPMFLSLSLNLQYNAKMNTYTCMWVICSGKLITKQEQAYFINSLSKMLFLLSLCYNATMSVFYTGSILIDYRKKQPQNPKRATQRLLVHWIFARNGINCFFLTLPPVFSVSKNTFVFFFFLLSLKR